MPIFIKRILFFSAIILIAAKVGLITAIFLYPKIISEDNIEVRAKELINLTNEYRTQNNLSELKVNARLTQAAVNKARDLLAKQYFNHTSPEGRRFSDWIKEVNYRYFYVGENLAIDFENSQDIFNAWLASPSHKENIVKPQYQEIGLAVLEGKYKNHPTIVVVQLFGTRILGETENSALENSPLSDLADNYFPQSPFWQNNFSLENLEKMNKWNSYFLIVIVGLYLIFYTPPQKAMAINIKQPIISRYQAKMFKE